MSESHVRQMLLVGEDPKKYINDYTKQFLSDFLLLLRTGHGEKQVHINRFYQEYIANKVSPTQGLSLPANLLMQNRSTFI
jgi:DNA/RNA-binding protein KIN17